MADNTVQYYRGTLEQYNAYKAANRINNFAYYLIYPITIGEGTPDLYIGTTLLSESDEIAAAVAALKVDIKENLIYNVYEEHQIPKITQDTPYKENDILIVTEQDHSNDKISYKSVYYCALTDSGLIWKPMNGQYKAEDVYVEGIGPDTDGKNLIELFIMIDKEFYIMDSRLENEVNNRKAGDETNTKAIGVVETRMTKAENDIATLQNDITGLSGAMHYRGASTTDPTSAGGPTVPGYNNFMSGDVVTYNAAEYVYNGSAWRLLGDESSYALKSNVYSKEETYTKNEVNALLTWEELN